MALVKCPECGNMISSRATFCPRCGCPQSFSQVVSDTEPQPHTNSNIINPEYKNHRQEPPAYRPKQQEEEEENNNNRNFLITMIVIFVVIGLIVAGFFIYQNIQGKRDEELRKEKLALMEQEMRERDIQDSIVNAEAAANEQRIFDAETRKAQEEKIRLEQEISSTKNWIQGTWKSITKYGETRVEIHGNLLTVWYDDTQYYRGPYSIENNKIYFNRRNGGADRLGIDNVAQCLMVDQDTPMYRYSEEPSYDTPTSTEIDF